MRGATSALCAHYSSTAGSGGTEWHWPPAPRQFFKVFFKTYFNFKLKEVLEVQLEVMFSYYI